MSLVKYIEEMTCYNTVLETGQAHLLERCYLWEMDWASFSSVWISHSQLTRVLSIVFLELVLPATCFIEITVKLS